VGHASTVKRTAGSVENPLVHAPVADPTRREARAFLFFALGVELGLAGVALIVNHFRVGSAWAGMRFDPAGFLIGLGLALPLLAGLAVVLTLPLGPLRRLRDDSMRLIGPLFRHAGPLTLVVIAMAAGFGEELLFRGVLQPVAEAGCVRLMPAPWAMGAAICLVSVVFAAFHGLSRSYFVLAFLVSVYLGFSVVLLRNLVPAMVAHGVYDLVALVYLVRRNRSQA
jgi:membrane protease YdiL (CAAX protease family)